MKMSLEIDDYGKRRKKVDSSCWREQCFGESFDRTEKPRERVPAYYIIPILGFYLLLAYLTQLIEDEMPAVVKESDLSQDNWNTFSEESANKYLDIILGDAPRVAGTKYHLNKTYDMLALVDDIASKGVQKVWTDWQIVSGNYFLGSTLPFVNVYVNASNIIAVLEGESGFHQDGTIGSSILVNCHYDSVPFAMGASDNAVFCAVMAETLSKLSKRPTKFKHNIVFLFNGAEENPLQASHGFLKHPWAKGVTSVINLDAAGMNGKPAVFQVSDPRVLAAFQRSVSRPNAQSFGEALFSSGIIPSDTDFRIFRDYGQIHGVDIAFVKWATVYHTRYDTASLIRPGVVQNAGNMVTNMLIDLADVADMEHKVAPTESVYCDYLNLFMVSYSVTISYVVDTIVVLCAILSIAYCLWSVGFNKSILIEFCYAIVGRIVSTLGGVLLVAILTLFAVATTIQLRYLSQPWIVAPMYWVPYFIGAVATSHVYDKWRCRKVTLPRSTRTLLASAATRCLLAVAAIITMFTPIPTYVTTVTLTFMTLVSVVVTALVRRLTGWQHMLLAVILSVPAAMFVYSLVLRMNAIMLPIMGRSPQDTPDYFVAGLNVAIAVVFSCILSGYELLLSRARLWIYLFAMLCVCVVISVIPLAPYNDDGPSTMRHYWYHTEIVTYDANKTPIEKSTGVMISKLDGNFLRIKRDIPPATSRDTHCDTRLYCDLPVYRTSFVKPLSEALWVNMSGPLQFSPPASLSAERQCAGNDCRYTFTMTGSAHNTITLFPLPNVSVVGWSFEAPVTVSGHALGRPVYILVHSLATYADLVDWHFTVDVHASHGFLKHPWAKGVTSVINLDAAGMNGKPAVFQVSDPRVLAAFQRSVSRPNAQSFGEALFSSGIIPSDTDFRIFRDYGQIHGVDIAFVKWATVYHTRYDTASLIRPGVVQNAGNMVTNMLIDLADVSDMEHKVAPTESVYCDYLNLFMVSYSVTISYVVDTIVVLCAILSIAYCLWSVGFNKSILIEFCYAIVGRIISTLGGVLLVAILTLFAVATTIQLRYLSQPWIVAPMYWVPYFIGAVATSHVYDKWRCRKVTLPRSTRTLLASAATRCLLAVAAIITMFTPIPTYVTTVTLTFMTLVSVVVTALVRRLTGWQHMLLAVILSVPAAMFVYSLVLRMNAIMLPIMGRSPQDTPDYFVAGLNVAIAVVFSCILSGYELLLSRARLWIYLFAMLCVCVVISVIPLAPYNDDGPSTMRHYWYHTEIVTYDANQTPIEKSTGVMISKLDGNFLRVSRDIPQATSRDTHCDSRLYCDLPVYRTSFVRPLSEALWVNMSGPLEFSPPASLAATRQCGGNDCRYTFTMTGSAHNTITLFPLPNVSVVGWSLDAPVTVSGHALGRPVYILVHSLATYSDLVDWHFTVNVHAPEQMISSSTPLLEVSHHAHKVHHPEDFTPDYVALMDSVPKYYNIATFLSFRHNYVF